MGQGVRGLRLPKIRGFPLTLNVALTTVLRTNVLHSDSFSYTAPTALHVGIALGNKLRRLTFLFNIFKRFLFFTFLRF